MTRRDGNVTTADFIALAERISGQQLDRFFRVWLYEEGCPRAGNGQVSAALGC
jgi:aminopeptidase N